MDWNPLSIHGCSLMRHFVSEGIHSCPARFPGTNLRKEGFLCWILDTYPNWAMGCGPMSKKSFNLESSYLDFFLQLTLDPLKGLFANRYQSTPIDLIPIAGVCSAA